MKLAPSINEALLGTAQWLEGEQCAEDGPAYYRGEFHMRLSGPPTRIDHNFLSGYALLHLVMARRMGRMPAAARAAIERILLVAVDVPRRYQSPAQLGNWYSGRGIGWPAPAEYPWSDGTILCLRDDFDDTAISTLLTRLGGFQSAGLDDAKVFSQAAYQPDIHELVPKSVRRLALSGSGEGVYMSWALDRPMPASDPGDAERSLVWLPLHNSIELTTVANVFAAAHVLDAQPTRSQLASRRFVNSLTKLAIERLFEGDASYLDFASSYYPRVPFAPLAYVVRDHVLTSGTLLESDVAALVGRAVCEIDPHAGWRERGFANPFFWLSCCAWCLAGGILAKRQVADRVDRIWAELSRAGSNETWPDIVFFFGAHLGNYSGPPYVAAVMIETLSLLSEGGFD